jgi:hypothetical protein
MLNMIPMDIIMKYERLRKALTEGDILKAVS